MKQVESNPSHIDDHAYVPPEDPNRHLCAGQRMQEQPGGGVKVGPCNMAEAAHAASTQPYQPTGKRVT